MPLKVELPDVPPLKALINGKTIYGWQKGGSTFTYQTTQLKIPILLHTEPHRYLIMACSVSMPLGWSRILNQGHTYLL